MKLADLDHFQLTLLNDLADGKTNYQIGYERGLNQAQLNTELLDMQAKLGARTPASLIHKAWQVGLFSAKQLCVCLVILTSLQTPDAQTLKPKTQRRAVSVRVAPKTANKTYFA